MTEIVKAATAHDFLALVPRLVGFAPTESIVFVAFSGNRTRGAMRFDLPARVDQRFHRRIATTLVGTLSRLRGVDAVVPVVYTGASFVADDGMPASAFVRTVMERFAFSGFEVRDALCVAGDGWGSYLDEDCPPGGRSLRLIEESAIADSIPASERRPLGDIEEWASIPSVDLATRERVARRLRTLFGSVATSGRGDPVCLGLPASMLEAALTTHGIAAWFGAQADEALVQRPDDLSDDSAAGLIFALGSPPFWELLAIEWAFGRQAAQRLVDGLTGDDTRETACEIRLLVLGRGARPDARRIERAILVSKALAARAPRANRAAVLAMLAWLNWALGRSTVAGRFVDAALGINPDHLNAAMLKAMLDDGELPDWAFGEGDADPSEAPGC